MGWLGLAGLQAAGLGEVAGYGKQVATTWALAFDQIERAGPGALQVPEGGIASRQHACRLERRCVRSR
jgi:hypothetical protein